MLSSPDPCRPRCHTVSVLPTFDWKRRRRRRTRFSDCHEEKEAGKKDLRDKFINFKEQLERALADTHPGRFCCRDFGGQAYPRGKGLVLIANHEKYTLINIMLLLPRVNV